MMENKLTPNPLILARLGTIPIVVRFRRYFLFKGVFAENFVGSGHVLTLQNLSAISRQKVFSTLSGGRPRIHALSGAEGVSSQSIEKFQGDAMGVRVFLLLSLLICTQLTAFSQAPHPDSLQKAFDKQLELSCQHADFMAKTVTDQRDEAIAPQQKEVHVERGDCLLSDELVYALEVYFNEEKTEELMDIQQVGDTLIATLKPDKIGSSPLRLQKLVLSPDGKTIRYLESHVKKVYWLYASDAHIAVKFDETGRYESHWLKVTTRVIWVGESVNVFIEGRMTY